MAERREKPRKPLDFSKTVASKYLAQTPSPAPRRRPGAVRAEGLAFRLSWLALLIVGLATLEFGLVVFIPGSDQAYLLSIGAAAGYLARRGLSVDNAALSRRRLPAR